MVQAARAQAPQGKPHQPSEGEGQVHEGQQVEKLNRALHFFTSQLQSSAYPEGMDGRSHERLTTVFLALTAPAVAYVAPQPLEAVVGYLAGGFVGMLFLSPDIDLEESRPSRRWGPLSVIWAPYRMTHPHRGASHSWVYGPISRLAYLALIAAPVLALLGIPPLEVAQQIPSHLDKLWPGLVGYLVSQWAHLVQDRVPVRAF